MDECFGWCRVVFWTFAVILKIIKTDDTFGIRWEQHSLFGMYGRGPKIRWLIYIYVCFSTIAFLERSRSRYSKYSFHVGHFAMFNDQCNIWIKLLHMMLDV